MSLESETAKRSFQSYFPNCHSHFPSIFLPIIPINLSVSYPSPPLLLTTTVTSLPFYSPSSPLFLSFLSLTTTLSPFLSLNFLFPLLSPPFPLLHFPSFSHIPLHPLVLNEDSNSILCLFDIYGHSMFDYWLRASKTNEVPINSPIWAATTTFKQL